MSSWGNIFHLLRFHAKKYGNGNESGYRKSTDLQSFIYKNAPTDNGTELHKKKEHTKKELTLECLIAKKCLYLKVEEFLHHQCLFPLKRLKSQRYQKLLFLNGPSVLIILAVPENQKSFHQVLIGVVIIPIIGALRMVKQVHRDWNEKWNIFRTKKKALSSTSTSVVLKSVAFKRKKIFE